MFGLLVFLLAGRFDYIQGWILLCICFSILLVTSISFRNQKDLIKERRNPGPGVKKRDTLIIGLYQVLLYAMIIIAILFVIRTVLEDRVLKEELSGYAEYARKVRYRLIPGIW